MAKTKKFEYGIIDSDKISMMIHTECKRTVVIDQWTGHRLNEITKEEGVNFTTFINAVLLYALKRYEAGNGVTLDYDKIYRERLDQAIKKARKYKVLYDRCKKIKNEFERRWKTCQTTIQSLDRKLKKYEDNK